LQDISHIHIGDFLHGDVGLAQSRLDGDRTELGSRDGSEGAIELRVEEMSEYVANN
jgi:hypothetical protein